MSMSTGNTSEFGTTREKFGRFRILIVGRANAGKTTILRGICNSTKNPEIYDGNGIKIQSSQVEPTRERGQHNIEDELIFGSNDDFVFHDSLGFEAGREDEFLKMKEFIADRANTTFLKKRIHAIWYCIPMDKLDRAIQRAEEKFFDEFDPGNVPVVVLFTKFDALLPVALGKPELADRRLPLQERLSKAEVLMHEIFSRANAWGRLSQMKHAPKLCVQIGGMQKSNEGCKSLLENTANVLDERALQMLLLSAQKTNIGLCIKYAAQDLISRVNEVHNSALPMSNMDKMKLHELAFWFPHVQLRWEGREERREWWLREWWLEEFWEERRERSEEGEFEFERELALERSHLDQELLKNRHGQRRASSAQFSKSSNWPLNNKHSQRRTSEVQLPKPSNWKGNFATWTQILQAAIDIVLISEHSFYLFQRNDSSAFFTAAKLYKASNIPDRIRKDLEEVIKQYGKLSDREKVDMILNIILQNHMEIPAYT